MATHFSSLAWKIQWTEEPGELSPQGREESATTEHCDLKTHISRFSEVLFWEKYFLFWYEEKKMSKF